MSESPDLKKIESEFEQQIQELRESIDRVGIRQDELKGFVFEISDTINEIKMQLATLPKEAFEARAKFHLAIQKNNELISRLYETISSFESVRHRYQQEIGKTTRDKIMFLNIEIKRVEDKFDNTSAGMTKFMKELRTFVSEVSKKPEVMEVVNDIESRPEYSME